MAREITVPGAAGRRPVVRVNGNLASVSCRPVGSSDSLVAELDDGSGRIRLVWMGQRQITGIEPGRPLTVEGVLGLHRGRKTMFNPRYQLDRL
jgi:hypothetical protein